MATLFQENWFLKSLKIQFTEPYVPTLTLLSVFDSIQSESRFIYNLNRVSRTTVKGRESIRTTEIRFACVLLNFLGHLFLELTRRHRISKRGKTRANILTAADRSFTHCGQFIATVNNKINLFLALE